MAPEAGELSGWVFGPVEMGDGVMSATEEESVREREESIPAVPLLDWVELSAEWSALFKATR